jgi:hypothetical protein
MDPKARFAGDTAEGCADMSPAKEKEPGTVSNRLDEDFHTPSTTHCKIPRQVRLEELRASAAEHFFGLSDDLMLDGSASDGSNDALILTDEHLASHLLG